MPKITEQQIKTTQQKRYAKRRKYTGATAPEKQNPPTTVIYGQILEIRAKKTQSHICDKKCAASDHRYVHKFSSRARILGLSNGDLLITTR